MSVLNIKDCNTCEKIKVCKFVEDRNKLIKSINEVVEVHNAESLEGSPITLSLSCTQHKPNVQERRLF